VPRLGEVIIGMAVGAAVLMVVLAAVFVRNRGGGTESPAQSETFSQEFETDGTPRIVVESWRGLVTVRGTGGTGVTVDVRRTGTGATEAEAFDNLTFLEARAVQDGDTITVRTFRTDGSVAPQGTRAVILVTVPAGATVEVVATGDEGVTVAGIAGPTAVTSESTVTLEPAPGAPFTLDAQTAVGTIEDELGLEEQPVANGSGEALAASRGAGGPAITLRAGTGITLRR
jgi:hypothetical protein